MLLSELIDCTKRPDCNPMPFTLATTDVGFYLARDVGCTFQSISYLSAKIGYSTTAVLPNKASAIAKTEDGGMTWSISGFLPDASAMDRGLYFTDESRRTRSNFSPMRTGARMARRFAVNTEWADSVRGPLALSFDAEAN